MHCMLHSIHHLPIISYKWLEMRMLAGHDDAFISCRNSMTGPPPWHARRTSWTSVVCDRRLLLKDWRLTTDWHWAGVDSAARDLKTAIDSWRAELSARPARQSATSVQPDLDLGRSVQHVAQTPDPSSVHAPYAKQPSPRSGATVACRLMGACRCNLRYSPTGQVHLQNAPHGSSMGCHRANSQSRLLES